ncbi:MAG: alpha/beta fold hydrolase [Lautropia sp.]
MDSARPTSGHARRDRVLLDGPGTGDRLDVIVEGEGDPVVLLPSSLRDSEDFDPLAARLADAGCRVLRPQPRGFGRSSPPADGMTLSTLAADVVHVIGRLGGGEAIVVGHAFGHFVARVADLEHPGSVRGVVVLAAAARVFPPGMRDTLDLACDAGQSRAARIEALERGFFAPGNDPAPWLDGWRPEWKRAYRLASDSPPKDRWWPVANAPILDLQGEADPWRPPSTRQELRAAIGESVTIATIAGASHAMVPERPDEVAAAILGWIRRLPVRVGTSAA